MFGGKFVVTLAGGKSQKYLAGHSQIRLAALPGGLHSTSVAYLLKSAGGWSMCHTGACDGPFGLLQKGRGGGGLRFS